MKLGALLITPKDSGFICPHERKCTPNQQLGLAEWNRGRRGRERKRGKQCIILLEQGFLIK